MEELSHRLASLQSSFENEKGALGAAHAEGGCCLASLSPRPMQLRSIRTTGRTSLLARQALHALLSHPMPAHAPPALVISGLRRGPDIPIAITTHQTTTCHPPGPAAPLATSHSSQVGSLKTFGGLSFTAKRLFGSEGDLAVSMPVHGMRPSLPLLAARRQVVPVDPGTSSNLVSRTAGWQA